MKNRVHIGIYLAVFLCVGLVSCTNKNYEAPSKTSFHWDNATIYFVYIDRFFNGNPDNDQNYNRKNDYNDETKNVATFHGGDLTGLTQKLENGYFKELGIHAIWITGVYEQIHGWVGGGDKNDFPHYAYHGYYPMDFTAMDKNFGTIEEFRKFVDMAHEQEIRVIMDAGINHPGYPTLLDAVQYQFGGVDMTEEKAREHMAGLSTKENLEHYEIYEYLQHFDFKNDAVWENWWGDSWIRSKAEVDKDVLTESIFGLPDFRTDSKEPVELPPLLKNKWSKEGEDFKPWVNPSAIKYRKDLNIAQTDYVIKWLASWVEEFGIDGFRCDVLDNVDLFRWKELNIACDKALIEWRKNNPEKGASQWTESFWTTGDIWDAGIDYKSKYAEAGFNSIVNFKFPKSGNLDSIGSVWQKYANELNTRKDWNTVSFLNNTYKRGTDMENMMNCGTALLLSPGAVQIFYGDEVARKATGKKATDLSHGYRSDYIWNQNPEMLEHWQKLSQFRKRHPAVGAGQQTTIDNNTFARTYTEDDLTDTIIIKLTDNKTDNVNVANIFSNGTELKNPYTGEVAVVKNNRVKFRSENGFILIEKNE